MTEPDSERGHKPKIDLNVGDVQQLEALPGIGPAYAAAIVLAREQDGPFRSPDALVNRGVVPERILDGIRDRVSTTRSNQFATIFAAAARPAAAARAASRHAWPSARRSARALRSRRARIGYAVSGAVLAVAALPILMLLSSIGDERQTVDPAQRVADATAEAPAEPTSASQTPPASGSPAAQDSADPTAVPVLEPPIRYIGNTDGDGVRLRTACEDEARADGAWPEGTEVVIEERGTGPCFTWSLVRNDDTTSWVRNVYLVEQGGVPIVTGTSSRLPNPGQSRAQGHCIDYRLGASYYRVCRTFPTLERALWTPWDLGTFGYLSYQRLQYFADCYVNNVRVGSPLHSCAFAQLSP